MNRCAPLSGLYEKLSAAESLKLLVNAIFIVLSIYSFAIPLFIYNPDGPEPLPSEPGHFRTEPTFGPSKVSVIVNSNSSRLSPGYFFMAPLPDGPNLEPWAEDELRDVGPQIFDMNGELIWWGNDTVLHRVQRIHLCNYLGEHNKHLCWHDRKPLPNEVRPAGVMRFFDNTYTQVGPDYGAAGGLNAPDPHEFNTPAVDNGETFLQDVYRAHTTDLRPYGGPKEGRYKDCCFQEIGIRNRSVDFQWCMRKHVPLWDTEVWLEHTKNWTGTRYGGNGRNNPWDLWHINGVDKNTDGDYLISIRHSNSLYKIAGNNNVHGVEPGTILWRLGGRYSHFQQDFNFTRQHSARFVNASNGNLEVVCLYNNAWAGPNSDDPASADMSNGQLIELNNQTMVARLMHMYTHPDKKLAHATGNMQVQPNGNVNIGWGFTPAYSEFAPDGELLYHATYRVGFSPQVWKYPWVGRPKQKPKLYLEDRGSCRSRHVRSNLTAYVSWNGATEVVGWRLYVSDQETVGPWKAIKGPEPDGVFPKHSFETAMPIDKDRTRYAYIEALGEGGEVLSMSEVAEATMCIQTKFSRYVSILKLFLFAVVTEVLSWTLGHWLCLPGGAQRGRFDNISI